MAMKCYNSLRRAIDAMCSITDKCKGDVSSICADVKSDSRDKRQMNYNASDGDYLLRALVSTPFSTKPHENR